MKRNDSSVRIAIRTFTWSLARSEGLPPRKRRERILSVRVFHWLNSGSSAAFDAIVRRRSMKCDSERPLMRRDWSMENSA